MAAAGCSALAGVEATVGKDVMDKILNSNILLVGSGGIGCELLKNLALSGFPRVEVIDLDTIDVSNLNRQFLFRSQHVGQPKCSVACEVSMGMSPLGGDKVKYVPHHGNVCDNTRFNVQYVSKFDLVLNALDNVTARRRVNRLCLAADVPLVEAGTTGYLGQVKTIHKSSGVACYECITQETQKVYPICTIRSTPSMPVHCIVWAKELYKLLFGKVEESMLYEDGEEPSTYMDAVKQYRQALESKSDDTRQSAAKIVSAVFVDEIDKQLGMGRYKTAKKTPSPLSEEHLKGATKSSDSTTAIWTPPECVTEFLGTLQEAVTTDPILPAFDKDDPLAMRFVTAAANLRQYIFGIEPLQSLYSAKGIAGNIIPAIATTNAIVAGLQILQAFHILKASLPEPKKSLKDCCKYVSISRQKTGRPGFYLIATQLDNPNPKCFVCRNATIPLSINTQKWDMEEFIATILKKELGFEQPTILIDGDIIYEEGEGADVEAYRPNLTKKLNKLPCGGIQHGTVVQIEDFSQDLEVDVCVTHQETFEVEEGDDETKKYVIGGEKPVARREEEKPQAKPVGNENGAAANDNNDDDDDVCIVVDLEEDGDKKPSAKRKAKDGENGEAAAKRARTDDNDDVVIID